MIKRLYEFLSSYSPRFEVFVRHVYYLFLKDIVGNKKKASIKHKDAEKFDKSLLIDYVESLGINTGDILIVHSSMDALSQFGMSPKEIIDWLLELVGPEGTLCMPAFPLYRENDYSLDSQTGETIITYDVKKTPCWTGLLPNLFLRYPGVIRSEFPYNPLAAIGKEAEAMMRDNLLGDKPHGKHSSWEYCVDHHAKVLFLGCQIHHSLTLLHIREDLDDSFPVKNWYRRQSYLVKKDEEERRITIFERDPIWARYLTEMHSRRVLVREELIKVSTLNSIPFGFISDTHVLKDRLFLQNGFNLLTYKIPKRFIIKEV